MNRAAVGMVTSGTATLEATFFEMPFVLIYKVAPVTWTIGKWLVRVPFLGISNILAGREIVREFLQSDARPKIVADELLSLLNNPEKRDAQRAEFRQVIESLGQGGASERAAEAILAELNEE
jgi:lipid-A-disaccharide synthase